MKFEQDIEQPVLFWQYDPVREFKTAFRVSFRSVTMADASMLHGWMNEVHVIPYWQLNIPFLEYKLHLEKSLSDDHQELLIGKINGRPVSYWEVYRVRDDIIGGYYDFDDYDQGVHLLIGDRAHLGKGFIYPLLMRTLHLQFQKTETEKVVAEPDVRNEKMIHVFKRCGFIPKKEVVLPDKTALLMMCTREAFERRWMDWQGNRF